jgi:hypothetical protein
MRRSRCPRRRLLLALLWAAVLFVALSDAFLARVSREPAVLQGELAAPAPLSGPASEEGSSPSLESCPELAADAPPGELRAQETAGLARAADERRAAGAPAAAPARGPQARSIRRIELRDVPHAEQERLRQRLAAAR